jgi:branched-chain amino acid transport system permease protein
MLNFGWNFFLAMLAGMLAAGAIALATGLVFSRLREVYYAFATIGFTVITYSIFLNWQNVTQGPLGLPGIPRPVLFGFQFSNNISFLFLAGVLLLIVYLISQFIIRSSFGRVLNAIREDEQMISIFGYATSYYKLVIFVIGAMLAALAGSLFASYISFIDPSSFPLFESIFILAIVILGGLGSTRGALLGALVLIILPEALRFVGFSPDIAAQMRQVVYGLILIVLMLYRPQGLLGKFRM